MDACIPVFGVSSTPMFMADVHATSGRGFSAEELADACLDKMLYISDGAPPAIRDQARAFRDSLRATLVHYLTQAQKSQNTTIVNVLEQAGQSHAAEVVRRL